MRETILALLVAKFQGARKDVLLHMARTLALHVADKEAAQKIVDGLTDAQVEAYTKEVRAEVDKEVSDSNKTYEANLKKKFDFVAKKTNEPGKGENGNENNDPQDLSTTIAAAVAAALKPINDQLATMTLANTAKSRLDTLNEKLSSCKDERFKAMTLKSFARMQFKDDAEFDEYIADCVKDIENANQDFADDKLNQGGGSPLFASKGNDGISQAVADFVKESKPENNAFTGKEV